MKNTLIVLFALFCISITASIAEAVDYYVSNSGNDSWTGECSVYDPGTNCGPWQTIDKVNDSFFQPGDTIHFRCGDVWHEQLIVPSSGTAEHPITFTSYGEYCSDDNKPLIKASQKIGEWTQHSDDIYVAEVQLPGSLPIKQLFYDEDNKYLRLAQYPDSGYLIIDQDSASNNYITDVALSGLPSEQRSDLVGAGIHIRSVNFRIEDREVSAYNSGSYKISWTGDTQFPIKKDYGYYLDNKFWMLDQAGEWFYDEIGRDLYAWFPGSINPNSYPVEASYYENGVLVSMKEYIVIDNLRIQNAAKDGIAFSGSPSFKLTNTYISDSGRNGVYVYNSGEGIIEECIVTNSVNQGIYVDGSIGVQILRNQVENSGTVGSPKNSYAAIYMGSGWAQIRENTVLNSGYNGINFARGTWVVNNVVESSCLILNDCGGIYTWNGNTPSIYYNSRVIGNIVVDTLGNVDGTPYTNLLASGIYLDDSSNSISVTGNTVVNSSRTGITLHNAWYVTVTNNTLYGNMYYQLALEETGNSSGYYMQNNSVNSNISFPLGSDEHTGLWGDYDRIDLGSFDWNTYSTLYSDLIATESVKPETASQYKTTGYNLSKWSQKGMDVNAELFSPFIINTARLIAKDPDNLGNFIANSTFDTSISPWGCSDYWGAKCHHELEYNLNNGCLKFTSSTSDYDSHLVSNKFSVVKGKTYMVEFNATADQSVDSVTATFKVRRAEGPWESVGFEKVVRVDNIWRKYRYIFTADETLNDIARLDIYLSIGGNILYLDDVTVYEVTAEFNDPEDDAHILINKDASAQLVYCPDENAPERCGQYIDLDQNAIEWPVTLAPYSSKIIVWTYNPFMKTTDYDGDEVGDFFDNCIYVYNPDKVDTDKDGLGDACDVCPTYDPECNEYSNTDGDGMPDYFELYYDVDYPAADEDGDGVSNLQEYLSGSNPRDTDTDDDGTPDTVDAHPADSERVWTDDPILAQLTPIKAVHMTELRTVIDNLRNLKGLSAYQWTTLYTGDPIKAVDITDLRIALGQVLPYYGKTPPAWETDPDVARYTEMQKAHIEEIRDAATGALD